MVVCCIWNSGVTIGDQRLRGGEFFRMITERARELLTTIKAGVLQSTNDYNQNPASPRGHNTTIEAQHMDDSIYHTHT